MHILKKLVTARLEVEALQLKKELYPDDTGLTCLLIEAEAALTNLELYIEFEGLIYAKT